MTKITRELDFKPSLYPESRMCVAGGFDKEGHRYKDNRMMWIDVTGGKDLAVGSKFTIDGLTECIIGFVDLQKIDTKEPLVFTVLEVKGLFKNRVKISPAIINQGGYQNCFGKAEKGSELRVINRGSV